MWIEVTIGIFAGFFVGFLCCVLFANRAHKIAVENLKRENKALERKVTLLEIIYSSRRSNKIRKKVKTKKSCEKGKCDNSCK